MKSILFRVAVWTAVLAVEQAPAQDSVVLDLAKTPTFSAPSRDLRPGDTYYVTIKGVNLNTHKVSVNARDTSLDTKLTFPDYTAFSLDPISKLVAGILPSIAAPHALQSSQLFNRRGFFGAALETARPARNSDATIRERIEAEQEALAREKPPEGFLKQLRDIKTAVERDYNLLEIEKLRGLAQTEAEQKIYDSLGTITAKGVITGFQTYRRLLATLRDSVKDRADIYAGFSRDYAVVENAIFQKADSLLKRSYTNLLAAIDTTRTTVAPAKATEAAAALMTLARNKSLTYTSLPFQFNKDQAKLDVRITPVQPGTGFSESSAEYLFPVTRRSYFGVGASAYGSGLHNEAISTQAYRNPGDTVDSYRLVDENPASYEFGFASLFKAGMKLPGKGDWFGGHLCVGPGISIGSTVRPRLLAGAGLSAGRNHSLNLDVGIIVGQVERRSQALAAGDGYTERPASTTVTVTSNSWFVALGYLFRL